MPRPNRRLLVGAAALALLVVGAFVVYQGRDDGAGQQPVEVATSFLEAYGDFDANQAITYLSDDAEISKLIGSVGAQGVQGTLEEFRLLISLLEAQGLQADAHLL